MLLETFFGWELCRTIAPSITNKSFALNKLPIGGGVSRIDEFGGKLYLEFGGKIFDDYHASRVLPGFLPDSKMKMLIELKDEAEMIIAINANDIEKSKVRGDIGITYDLDVLRLIDIYSSFGLVVRSVVLTQYNSQPLAKAFSEKPYRRKAHSQR